MHLQPSVFDALERRPARRYRLDYDSTAGGHPRSLTVIDAVDGGARRVFLDAHEVPASAMGWVDGGRGLVLHDGAGSGALSGQLFPQATPTQGLGWLVLDGREVQVGLDPVEPSYDCLLAANAGCSAQVQGGSIVLSWDTAASAWRGATWVDALTFKYKVVNVGSESIPVYQTYLTFVDRQTGSQWETDDTEAAIRLYSDNRFLYALTPGFEVGEDPRSDLPAPGNTIQTVFPYQMAFTFASSMATRFNGAILTGTLEATGAVYGISGTVENHAIVGRYRAVLAGRTTLLSIGGGQLLHDGVPIAQSSVRGDRLVWAGLSDETAHAMGLPLSGSLTFSEDGERILDDGTGTGGARVPTGFAGVASGRAAAAPAGPLDLSYLMAMDPFSRAGDSYTDEVLAAATGDLSAIAQYYMEPQLRSTFISANPPNLPPSLLSIATSNPDNRWFYNNLQVPFLVSNLGANRDDADARTLNRARANRQFSNGLNGSALYRTQSDALYRNRWNERFPLMEAFLADQRRASAQHTAAIEADAQAWKAAVNKQFREAGAVEGNADWRDMLRRIDDLQRIAVQGAYWAWKLFHAVTSPIQLNFVRQQMLQGQRDSAQVPLLTKRYTTLLDLLDPTQSFSKTYVQQIGAFQVGSVLPELVDFGHNASAVADLGRRVLQAYAQQYADSPQPAAREAAALAARLLAAQTIETGGGKTYGSAYDYFAEEVLSDALSLGSTISFAQLFSELSSRARSPAVQSVLQKAGFTAAAVEGVLKVFSVGLAVSAIGLLVSGRLAWDQLKDAEKASLIIGLVSVLAQGAAMAIKGTLQIVALYRELGGQWMSLQHTWTTWRSFEAEGQMSSGLARWLIREGKGVPPATISDLEILFEYQGAYDFAREQPVVARLLGRNLDEFMAYRIGAALGIANLVLSAIFLAESTDDLEWAGNSLVTASAAFSLIASLGGWGFSLAGSFETAAMFCSGLNALATVVAVAGFIVLVIDLVRHKPAPPIQTFAKDQANAAGLYMPLGAAIESLRAEQVGVGTLFRHGADDCLTLAAQGDPRLGRETADVDTLLYVVTDDKGQSQIFSIDPATFRAKALAERGDGVSTVDPFVDKDGVSRWMLTPTGSLVWADDDPRKERIVSGTFTIQRPSGKYLAVRAGALVLVPTPVEWSLALKPRRPAGLRYGAPDAVLTLGTGGLAQPSLSPVIGQVGAPDVLWSVEPPLPGGARLDAGSGRLIAERTSQSAAARTYTVTARNRAGASSTSLVLAIAGEDAGRAGHRAREVPFEVQSLAPARG